VFIDGRFAVELSDPVITRLALRVGADVDEGDLERYEAAERAYLALQAALAFLEPRMRSSAEIVSRLRRRKFEDDAIAYTLERLRSMGLVDDAEFAARWVAARARTEGGRPIGRRRIKSELIVKGIAAEEIEEAVGAVSDEDELALAMAAAKKKVRGVPVDPEQLAAQRRRLAAFLQRRGFGWDVVKRVLDEVLTSDDNDEALDAE
jgi:regulatory protein